MIRRRTALLLIVLFLTAGFGAGAAELPQTKTAHECQKIGEAFARWATDQGGDPGPAKSVRLTDYPVQLTREEMESLLVPKYLDTVPELDAWRRPYEFFFTGDVRGPQVFLIRSAGADGLFAPGPYSQRRHDKNTGDDVVFVDGLTFHPSREIPF